MGFVARMQETFRRVAGGYLSEAFDPVVEDPDAEDWLRATSGMDRWQGVMLEEHRLRSVNAVRWLCAFQPNVKRALGLYQNYVLGRGFAVTLRRREMDRPPTEAEKKVTETASRVWDELLRANFGSWSPREFGVRAWRDGDSFTHLMPGSEWPAKLRFYDTEGISGGQADELGIVTDPNDPTVPLRYLVWDQKKGMAAGSIDAEDMVHVKIDVDSNIRRGQSRFVAVVDSMKKFRAFVDNEVTHRNLQSSIVMHRKMKGTAAQIDTHLDNLKTSTTNYRDADGTQSLRREKVRPGSIVTTNMGVEIDFKHPDSNFTDASPLARLLVAQTCAATGWPYFMVAGDSADSSYASSLVQESPVVLMVQDEQDFFARYFERIFLWALDRAGAAGRFAGLPESPLDDFVVDFSFPSLVTRDGLKEAQATNIYRMAGGLSAAEVSRRAGADPVQMQAEMNDELERGFGNAAAAMNPDPADKTAGGDNATGTNQGAPAGGHSDNVAGQ